MAIEAVDVLTLVKSRLRLTDANLDGLIDTYVQEIEHRILHYCNINEVPDGLKFVWCSMVVDALKVEQASQEEIQEASGGAVNVKIGDTQTSPASNSAGITDTSKSIIEGIVLNYSIDLNRYRRLRW